jgi:hypothetical protein
MRGATLIAAAVAVAAQTPTPGPSPLPKVCHYVPSASSGTGIVVGSTTFDACALASSTE